MTTDAERTAQSPTQRAAYRIVDRPQNGRYEPEEGGRMSEESFRPTDLGDSRMSKLGSPTAGHAEPSGWMERSIQLELNCRRRSTSGRSSSKLIPPTRRHDAQRASIAIRTTQSLLLSDGELPTIRIRALELPHNDINIRSCYSRPIPHAYI